MNEAYYILTGCLLLGLLLLYWEFRGKGRLKTIRILVTVLLMVSLYFLLSTGGNYSANIGLLVVTPGSSEMEESEFRQNHRNWNIVRVNTDRPYGFSSGPEVDSIVIIGNGLLADSDIDLIAESGADYQYSTLPEGITSIQIPQILQANTDQTALVEFTEGVKRVLYDRQGRQDTLIPGESGALSLPLNSPVAGRFVYRLTLMNEKSEAIGTTELPVLFREARPLSVAFRANFPLAEINYLKNHLANAGHSVTSAIQLSRNITTWDFINTSENKRNLLSRLDEFDILFITNSALNSFTAVDSRRLSEAMNNGLGVFIWRDVSNSNRNFSLSPIKAANVSASSWEDQSIQQFAYSFLNPHEVVINNDLDQALLVEGEAGKGTMVESLVSQSYPMLLRGDSVGYRTFWNIALSRVQRNQIERFIDMPEVWKPRTDFPIEMSFQSDWPLEFSIDSIDVNVDQDPFQSDIWHARFWPLRNGWHKVVIADSLSSDSAFFYVGAQGWDHLRAHEIQQKNGRFAKNAHSVDPGSMSVPRTLWIVLCCCCFVYLWAEPRFL